MRALALISFIALLIWLVLRGARPDEAPRGALVVGAPERADLALRCKDSPLTAGRLTSRSSVREASADGVETPERGTTTSELELPEAVGGDIVLVDEHGVERAGLDGWAECVLWRGGRQSDERLSVKRGKFQSETWASSFELKSVVLDGRNAFPEAPDRIYEIGDQSPVVRVVLPPQIRLRVLDAASRRHLDHVEIHKGSSRTVVGRASADREGQIEGPAWKGHSPLTLGASTPDAKLARMPLLVHSPGYAWTPVAVDFRARGEHEVLLERGGHLKVELDGELPRYLGRLRLYRADCDDGRLVAERRTRGESRHEFADLPAGTYRVAVEAGQFAHDSLGLGEALADIQAGGHQLVMVEVEQASTVVRAPMTGVVNVPQEWGIGDSRVFAELHGPTPVLDNARNSLSLDRLLVVDGSDGSRLFDFGKLPTGRYTVGVLGMGLSRFGEHSISVDLGPEGVTDIYLEVPPPAPVTVSMVDRATREDIQGAIVWWNRTPGRPAARKAQVQREVNIGCFEFLAPVGEIIVRGHFEGYTPIDEILTIHPGPNTFSFTAERASIVRLLLRDGETSVPWSDDWFPVEELLEGEGDVFSASGRVGERSVRLSVPGPYRLGGFEIEGFEAVESIEFSALQGETIDHVIALKRK